MKKKIIFTALFFVAMCSSTLFVGCSAKYDGVPRNARTYWDYILNQYANPEELQYDAYEVYFWELGKELKKEYMFYWEYEDAHLEEKGISFDEYLATIDESRKEYRMEHKVPTDTDKEIPPVNRIEVNSWVDVTNSSYYEVIIRYRVPDSNRKYQNCYQRFYVVPNTDVAYIDIRIYKNVKDYM